jgi:hypothetical protein
MRSPIRTILTGIKNLNYSLIKSKPVMPKEINNMKSAVALSAFRAGGGGKPKWATIMALRDGWKFWFSRADRFKQTRPFWFLFGAMPKRTI